MELADLLPEPGRQRAPEGLPQHLVIRGGERGIEPFTTCEMLLAHALQLPEVRGGELLELSPIIE